MNFTFRKNNNDLVNNDEVFEVKDLYITSLGKVKLTEGIFEYYASLEILEDKVIIVKRINHNKKVKDILNNLEYYHFYSNSLNSRKYYGIYMVGELKPLSMFLEDKTKTKITKRELLSIFYPQNTISNTNEYKDVILEQIKKTNDKINKLSLSEEDKNNLKNKLIEIARNYVDSLKNMTNHNKNISLNTDNESIINLRREVMKKLVEIEMELPPESIDNISNELEILEQEIFKHR